mmetsp:Transcript_1408/g.2825  ORF Transcript_1408/g.2825 Transcript_1408/m.2825 type:complete len:96 (+) Transcript_1408:140-427(+)
MIADIAQVNETFCLIFHHVTGLSALIMAQLGPFASLATAGDPWNRPVTNSWVDIAPQLSVSRGLRPAFHFHHRAQNPEQAGAFAYWGELLVVSCI